MKHYSSIPDKPAEFMNGITTEYKGFEISDRFVVSKAGKVIWDDNISLQQCKNIIDQSLKMKALQDLGASFKKFVGTCELENGSEQREYEAKRVDDYFENQLNEMI